MQNATKEDFEEVFQLLKQLWPDKKLNKEDLQRMFHESLKDPKQEYIVARYEKKIVGFVSLTIRNSLWQEGNLGHVDELIVDEKFRNKGMGTKLLKKIIKISKEKKCKRIELDSAFHRKEAHKFYESLGFENRAYLFSKDLSTQLRP